MNFIEGEVLLFNKPLNWTSFDVVKKIRGAIRIKKTGHAGTLDPLATGLLILCTGKKTKSIQEIQDAQKEYIAEIQFGATTPCYDLEMPPENIKDTTALSEQSVREALKAFLGEIEQYPPRFSAVKVKGQRAFHAARNGEKIELKSRKVIIYALEVLSFSQEKKLLIRVECSKGTYIRSLAHDLGQALGYGAYLSGLVRTRIGDYTIENAWQIEEFIAEAAENRQKNLKLQEKP